MKIAALLLLILLMTLKLVAQDTIPGQVIRVDTVVVEKVRVDTIREVVQVPANQQTQAKPVSTEQKQPGLDRNKVYYGGYANLSFGKYTVIGVEPMIGYKLLPKLSVGAKFSYEYIKDNRYRDYTYEYSNYGISLFSRFRVTQRIYTHAEFSEMSYKLYDSEGNHNRKWVPFLFLGGGYSQPITRNTWLTAEVLFDVLQNKNSPYKAWEPFFSVGFGVGF